MQNQNIVPVKIHPEQTEREQLHTLVPKLTQVKQIGVCHLYKKFAKDNNCSIHDIIEAIPESKIHEALTRVRNELIMEMI
jgi:hypothetical protein